MVGLSKHQERFVHEFLKLRKKNATQAAVNAGYSEKSAASQASQLLKNPKVLEFLEQEETEYLEALWQEFKFDALEARQVLHEIMKDPFAKDSDRISAAKDFLDRAGFKAIDKIEHSGAVDISGTADKLRDRLRQRRESDG